jgi:Tfp pilus assembly ATPase PilU
MQTFNQALATSYFQKQISLEMALQRSSNVDELQEMINRGASLLTRPTTAGGVMAKGAATAKR